MNTWEPQEVLGNAQVAINEFLRDGSGGNPARRQRHLGEDDDQAPRCFDIAIESYPPAIEALNAKQEVDEVPIPLEDESMDDAALRDVPISRSTR